MPTEPRDRTAGEIHFAHLGGMEFVSTDQLRHRRRGFLFGILGFGVLTISFLVWWSFRPLYPHLQETIAISRLRTISSAEEMYRSSYPAYGYTCSLSALSGDPAEGPPSPTAAQLIRGDLDRAIPSPYIFQITNCKHETVDGRERVVSYTILAIPLQISKGTKRGFCVDQTGTIKVDPSGGSNCTRSLFE